MIKRSQVLGRKYLADIEADITDGIDYKTIWRFDYCKPSGCMWTVFNHKADELSAKKIRKYYDEYVVDLADDYFGKLLIYGYQRGKELPILLASVTATHRYKY